MEIKVVGYWVCSIVMARAPDYGSSLLSSARSTGRLGLIDDLKDNHERLLSSISQQLQAQETRLQDEVTQLQAENLRLRDLLATKDQEYQASLERLRSDAQNREAELRRHAETTVQTLEDRLESLRMSLAKEQDERKELDAEILDARRRDQAELGALHARNQEIQSEFDLIKTKTLPLKDRETEMLRSELEQMRSDVFLLQEQLSLRERKEGGLRAELERVQASSSRDLISLQETIKANHRAMELQDEDMARLRKAKDEARVEVRRLQSSLAETQQELEILRNRYGDLQQQYSRLDALVRGRKKA